MESGATPVVSAASSPAPHGPTTADYFSPGPARDHAPEVTLTADSLVPARGTWERFSQGPRDQDTSRAANGWFTSGSKQDFRRPLEPDFRSERSQGAEPHHRTEQITVHEEPGVPGQPHPAENSEPETHVSVARGDGPSELESTFQPEQDSFSGNSVSTIEVLPSGTETRPELGRTDVDQVDSMLKDSETTPSKPSPHGFPGKWTVCEIPVDKYVIHGTTVTESSSDVTAPRTAWGDPSDVTVSNGDAPRTLKSLSHDSTVRKSYRAGIVNSIGSNSSLDKVVQNGQTRDGDPGDPSGEGTGDPVRRRLSAGTRRRLSAGKKAVTHLLQVPGRKTQDVSKSAATHAHTYIHTHAHTHKHTDTHIHTHTHSRTYTSGRSHNLHRPPHVAPDPNPKFPRVSTHKHTHTHTHAQTTDTHTHMRALAPSLSLSLSLCLSLSLSLSLLLSLCLSLSHAHTHYSPYSALVLILSRSAVRFSVAQAEDVTTAHAHTCTPTHTDAHK